jgi:hypothetical protein
MVNRLKGRVINLTFKMSDMSDSQFDIVSPNWYNIINNKKKEGATNGY